jgi:glycosyltransferase involved in cell wall biosynthesis
LHLLYDLPKMSRALVSVVLPLFNAGKTIDSCLMGITRQTYEPLEIIVIDDGSSDGSAETVKERIGDLPNFVLIRHQTNQGLGSTLNEGLTHAHGKYILIVHQDCEMVEPWFIQTAVETLEKNADIAGVTGCRVYPIEELSSKEKFFMVANGHQWEVNSRVPAELTFLENKCDLYRKSVLERIGGFPSQMFRTSGEDQLISWFIRRLGYRLVRLGEISYRIRFGQRESTIRGILSKVYLYGRTQAGVIHRARLGAVKGITRSRNLLARALSRFFMLLSTTIILVSLALTAASGWFGLLTFAMLLLRSAWYASALRKLKADLWLTVFGPLADLLYAIGFVHGLLLLLTGRRL